MLKKIPILTNKQATNIGREQKSIYQRTSLRNNENRIGKHPDEANKPKKTS